MSPAMRPQVDDSILDAAAELFARRGFEHTSVQAVADRLGYSKAGLLHHYSTKDALRDAVLDRCDASVRLVVEQVQAAPRPARSRRAVELLVELALVRPGFVALTLASGDPLGTDEAGLRLRLIVALLYRAFDADIDGDDIPRLIRITGALAALGVLALAAQDLDDGISWRPHIIATCLDALGTA